MMRLSAKMLVAACSMAFLSGLTSRACTEGPENEPIRRYGFIVNVGGTPGSGLGFSTLYSPRHQVRSLIGFVSAESDLRFSIDSVPGYATPVETRGVRASLEYRYYPEENLFVKTGYVHTVMRASYTYTHAPTGETYKGKGRTPLHSIPLLIGGELSRNAFLSGYVEAGALFHLNNHESGGGTPIEGDIPGLVFFNDPWELKIGLGASLNWGRL